MSDDKTESAYRSHLPKLVDDGLNNNYGDWATKAFHNLRTWDLWKYIEGPHSIAPIIPSLREAQSHHGVDDDGHMVTAHVPSNKSERDDAIKQALPWTEANNLCLTKIINAVPSNRMHLVKRFPYAKQAWENLKSTYQPRNSLRASALKSDITAFRCQLHMDVIQWLNDMQQLFNTLCDIDPENMTDSEFAAAILDKMPQDGSWRPFLAGMRKTIQDYAKNDPPTSISSIEVIASVREEYWCRQRENPHPTTHVFSATGPVADARAFKRVRPANVPSSATPPPKRVRNTDKHCTNSHCGSPKGHEFQNCMAYGGGNQGKYADWWRGPWNIHLPPEQRNKANNVPPTSHPAYASFKASAPKPTVYYTVDTPTSRPDTSSGAPPAIYYAVDTSTSRADMPSVSGTVDDDPHIHSVVSNEVPSYVSNVDSDNVIIVANLPILSDTVTPNSSCYYDSGANRHVFHDRAAFETYDAITPLTVKGFGHHLSTVAIGRGSIRLRCTQHYPHSTILLNHVLHIPAAHSNLISGVQLDRAGVTASLGNGCVTLSLRGSSIITGVIENNMYRLNVQIIPPVPVLLSQSSPIVMTSINTDQTDFYTASWGI
jgi:gag-polypeptide of LTR copia-type